ncbi:CAF17-like 4Fe-4S cluster assembly/insertion protein YgfZ [Alteromonas sp. CYL-A6]|uniref:CAF17-like 4Fe-4S cluster assembly/insertion protein YgfZ n=1 Tax=Alteromonas nitratireducens TaxID=3390813 RepID=UPI0034C0B353
MTPLLRLDALSEHFFIRLTDQRCITVTGDQRNEYLHGQLTVNINKLTDDEVRFGAHCDNKGKTWALMDVVRYDDAILLLTGQDAAQHSLAQLQKYGVFSKVEMTQEAGYSQLLVSHALAPALLDAVFGSTSNADHANIIRGKNGLAYPTRLRGAYRFVLTTQGQAAADAFFAGRGDSISEYATPVFHALGIEAGIPAISEPAISEYVPQMMNVQALNGIDFDKGCYMGQEVIARTRFLGKNKRAAYIFRVPAALAVHAGDTLEKQLGDNWRRGGNVIRCATLGEETWLMAVLANDTGEHDAHRLAGTPDVTMTPHTLPYTIEQHTSSVRKA